MQGGQSGVVPRVLEVFSVEELRRYFVPAARLGKGGFGTVFRAALSGRGDVAVKRLRLGDEGQGAQVSRHHTRGGKHAWASVGTKSQSSGKAG
jgi:hypothetical protein